MDKQNRELLELAAKAAGPDVFGEPGCYFRRLPMGLVTAWNPLADDGDALRLAVRMAQLFGFYRMLRAWLIAMATAEGNPGDPYAATRLAIVQAAAEIGRAMP
jgi:hypothetical protein